MRKSLTTCLAAAFLSTSAYAGLFGPSNIDECVLDGVKDAKTETAAKLVAQACHNKFPAQTQPTKEPIRVGFDFYNKNTGQWAGLTDKLSVVSTSAKTDYYSQKYNQIRIMNGYGFDLSSISVGIIKPGKRDKGCPTNFSSYKEVFSCTGSALSKQSGNFNCPPINGSYCLTGFIGDFGNRTEKEVKNLLDSEFGVKR